MCHNGITQCYLPPGIDDIPAFTPVKLVLDVSRQSKSDTARSLVSFSLYCGKVFVKFHLLVVDSKYM